MPMGLALTFWGLNLLLFFRLNLSRSSLVRRQSPEEAEQGSKTTLRPLCWEQTELSSVFSGLVHIIYIETRWLNLIWKVIQRCLECDNELLGNQQLFEFLAIEHLFGIQSNVEEHYQRLFVSFNSFGSGNICGAVVSIHRAWEQKCV